MDPGFFPHHFPAAVLPGIDRKVSPGLGLMIAQEHLPATILKLQSPKRVLQLAGNLGLCSAKPNDPQSSPFDPALNRTKTSLGSKLLGRNVRGFIHLDSPLMEGQDSETRRIDLARFMPDRKLSVEHRLKPCASRLQIRTFDPDPPLAVPLLDPSVLRCLDQESEAGALLLTLTPFVF